MLNNNVALTVQLTDVANAPKNADGTIKFYHQAKKENNYRGCIINYKPETHVITITGTLTNHSDLFCQVGGTRDKYTSIKANSLSGETRVTFVVKLPKGSSEYWINIHKGIDECRKNTVDRIIGAFDVKINSFANVNKVNSIVYCAANEEQPESLTVFINIDAIELSFSKDSEIKRAACLTRKTKTIELS